MRILAVVCCSLLPLMAQNSTRIELAQGWTIQSSAKVQAKGDSLSAAAYRPADWYRTTVPATVVAALVTNHVYPDPYFGMNLRSYPGMTYQVGMNFANLPMAADSPFAASWWYRTEFRLPPSVKGKAVWLNFDSINYRANIWLNGHQIASAEKVAGMYRMFEFDVTEFARAGAANGLAVEVFPPGPNDLSITFVDWNPMPPDKDMGLVRDVYVLTSGPVSLRHPQVLTTLAPAHDRAQLSASAELRNASAKPVEGMLKAELGGRVVSKKVTLGPKETAHVELAAVDVANPKLWWPYPLGPQNLEHARLEFVTGGAVSDRQDLQFGIREVTSELDARKHRVFKINGEKILIRGGGWTQDMLLRWTPERENDELRYVRDLNLNTVRLEGKLMNDHFFETADRQGILVMAGWCCCSFWERWKNWKPEDYPIAGESLRDQVRRLRNHPSMLTWLYGSDESPNAEAEAVYLKVLKEERLPVPAVSSAADRTTTLTGITGVKMTGPYDYVAPDYWLEDKKRGGAWGFNTETSPGPAIPELASLKEMLPKEHLWPIDDFWNFHAGGGGYRTVNIFTKALEERYGKATGLEDYVRKSQLMTYEGERAMFEAYGRNKYDATGVVQWMLNNAWPSTIWHLYDYYLRPGGGYFGTKKACEPLHAQYSYDDRSVAVVNSFYRAFPGHTVTAKVYNLDLAEKFSKTAPVEIGPDAVVRAFEIPELAGLSDVYFIRLWLKDAAGKTVAENFYWLSTKPDVSDWAKGNGRYTPIQSYADFTSLDKLPRVDVKVNSRPEARGGDDIERVTVENTGAGLAFFVRLSVEAAGRDVAPVIWSDNYISLMPGEKRELTATVHRKDLGGAAARVKIDGWNLAAH
jgi:exo-1,4-beta-D-glucosaminidase